MVWPQKKIHSIKGIVIHWVANPNSTAIANRNFFENRKYGTSEFGSAHYIIGLSGEIIQCLPEDEIGYHVGSSLPYRSGSKQIYTPAAWEFLNHKSTETQPEPNYTTIGIECCHLDWDGKMTHETYDSTIELVVNLLNRYRLKETDVWLHQEVVGWKDCHRWFVNHPSEWQKFKNLVRERLQKKEESKLTSQYFNDVAKDHWSAQHIDSLYEKGIVTGKSNGKFDPTALITREEVATIIDRAIKYLSLAKK